MFFRNWDRANITAVTSWEEGALHDDVESNSRRCWSNVSSLRVIGLFTVILLYVTVLTEYIRIAECSRQEGCRGGTTTIWLATLAFVGVLIALFPSLLHPAKQYSCCIWAGSTNNNCCRYNSDRDDSDCIRCCPGTRKHNQEDNDRDYLLPANVSTHRVYGSDALNEHGENHLAGATELPASVTLDAPNPNSNHSNISDPSNPRYWSV